MFNALAGHLVALDRSAFQAINSGLNCTGCDILMPAFSFLGLGHVQFLTIVGAAVWRAARVGEIDPHHRLASAWKAITVRRRWVTPLLLALALSGTISGVAKHMVHRQRPAFYYANRHRARLDMSVEAHTIPGIRPLRVNGFPSGHTATSVALALTLAIICRRYRPARGLVSIGWAVAGLVGLSRIYMADHWPLDVAGGVVVGLISGAIVCSLLQPHRRVLSQGTEA